MVKHNKKKNIKVKINSLGIKLLIYIYIFEVAN